MQKTIEMEKEIVIQLTMRDGERGMRAGATLKPFPSGARIPIA